MARLSYHTAHTSLLLMLLTLLGCASTGGPPELDSHWVQTDIPPQMVAGELYRVVVVYRNTGTAVWEESDLSGRRQVRLEVVADEGAAWGTRRVLLEPSEVVVPMPATTGISDTKAFEFVVQAPATPGVYGFTTRMLSEGESRFGDVAAPRYINVRSAVADVQDRLVIADFSSNLPTYRVEEVWLGTCESAGSEVYTTDWPPPPGHRGHFRLPIFVTDQKLRDWRTRGTPRNLEVIGLEPPAGAGQCYTFADGHLRRLEDHFYLMLWWAGKLGVDVLVAHGVGGFQDGSRAAVQRLCDFEATLKALFAARDRLRSEAWAAPALAFFFENYEAFDGDRRNHEVYTAGSADLLRIWHNMRVVFDTILEQSGGVFDPGELLMITDPVDGTRKLMPFFLLAPQGALPVTADQHLVSGLEQWFHDEYHATHGVELAVIPSAHFFDWDRGRWDLHVTNAVSYFNTGVGVRVVDDPESGTPSNGDHDSSWFGITTVAPAFDDTGCQRPVAVDASIWKTHLEAMWNGDTAGNWIRLETFDFWSEGNGVLCSYQRGCDYFDAVKSSLGERQYER